MAELHLEGLSFDILLTADRRNQTRSHGSDYVCYEAEHFWYNGIGKVVDRNTGQERVFLFSTHDTEDTPADSLKDAIFTMKGMYSSPDPLIIVPGRESQFVDFLSRRIITKIEAEKNEIIPRYFFDWFEPKELILNGFVADETGQIFLPMIAALT